MDAFAFDDVYVIVVLIERYLGYLEEELSRCAKRIMDDFATVMGALTNRLMYRLKTRRAIVDPSGADEKFGSDSRGSSGSINTTKV